MPQGANLPTSSKKFGQDVGTDSMDRDRSVGWKDNLAVLANETFSTATDRSVDYVGRRCFDASVEPFPSGIDPDTPRALLYRLRDKLAPIHLQRNSRWRIVVLFLQCPLHMIAAVRFDVAGHGINSRLIAYGCAVSELGRQFLSNRFVEINNPYWHAISD